MRPFATSAKAQVPNLISLLVLNRVLVAKTRRHLWEAGPEPASAPRLADAPGGRPQG